jgi:hypothetical protein
MLFVSIFVLASLAEAEVGCGDGTDGAATDGVSATVVRGHLSVTAVDAPLENVLCQVARAAGVTVSLQTPLPRRLSVSFRDRPLDDGLRRLLGDTSFTLVYGEASRSERRPPGEHAGRGLREVRVLAAGTSDDVGGKSGVPPAGQRARTETASRGQPSVGALASLLVVEDDGGRRAEMVAAIGRTWSADAVDPLSRTILDDDDPTVRLAAVAALGETWSEDVVEPLALALFDEDALVREEAADALGDTWDDAAVGPLAEALLWDSHWYVRERAAVALGEIGSPAAIGSLRKALSDEDPSVRERAAVALDSIGRP